MRLRKVRHSGNSFILFYFFTILLIFGLFTCLPRDWCMETLGRVTVERARDPQTQKKMNSGPNGPTFRN